MTFNQVVWIWQIDISTFTRFTTTKFGRVLTTEKRFSTQMLKSSPTSCFKCFSKISRCKIARIQRHIQNSVKRLKWAILQKYLTAFSRFLLLKKVLPFMFDRVVVNTALEDAHIGYSRISLWQEYGLKPLPKIWMNARAWISRFIVWLYRQILSLFILFLKMREICLFFFDKHTWLVGSLVIQGW